MNLSDLIKYLGFVAAFISAVSYGPQIWHLYREHCSAGISVRAWALWVVSGLLFLAHALNIRDAVFMSFSGVNVTAQVTITAMAKRYAGMT